jgi:hypothetical protein
LLTLGVNLALSRCAKIYDPNLSIDCRLQRRSGESLSRVDCGVFEEDLRRILMESKSPAVMMALRERLPVHGANLIWRQGGNLISKVFLKVISFPPILYDA